MGLPSAELEAQAYQTLVGPRDCTYTGGVDHNFRLYSAPDGKVRYLPWDWDSAFQHSTSALLVGGGNWSKLVTRPANLRVYHGHLKDIIEKAFNTSYIGSWTTHYGALGGTEFCRPTELYRIEGELRDGPTSKFHSV